jgi:hypothetical protein
VFTKLNHKHYLGELAILYYITDIIIILPDTLYSTYLDYISPVAKFIVPDWGDKVDSGKICIVQNKVSGTILVGKLRVGLVYFRRFGLNALYEL